MESLQSHCIHTEFHWSHCPPPSWGTRVQSPGGTFVKPGISCKSCLAPLMTLTWLIIVASSEAGLVPTRHCAVVPTNVIISLDLTQLFCPGFTLAAGPPSGFTTDIVGCWEGALWRACIHTQVHKSSGPPVCFPSWGTQVQSPGGTYVKPGFSC